MLVAHLSDLHFGRHDPAVVEVLRSELNALDLALVAVSGDLTQRARRGEFETARTFLDSLVAPKLVVPGNHDIPLLDVVRRFVSPLGRYRRLVTDDLAPFFAIPGLAILGVNTARSARWKDGRLSVAQIDLIRSRFCSVGTPAFKVLVTHHPFLPPPGETEPALVERGPQALLVAERCGVDLLLAGHLYLGYTGDVRSHHVTIRRSILVAQAGTATSVRTRGEPNGYNLVRLDAPCVELHARVWDGRAFAAGRMERYERVRDGWRALPAPGTAGLSAAGRR